MFYNSAINYVADCCLNMCQQRSMVISYSPNTFWHTLVISRFLFHLFKWSKINLRFFWSTCWRQKFQTFSVQCKNSVFSGNIYRTDSEMWSSPCDYQPWSPPLSNLSYMRYTSICTEPAIFDIVSCSWCLVSPYQPPRLQ